MNERIIDSYADLSKAKEAKKRYESMSEYCDGLITIEKKQSLERKYSNESFCSIWSS